MAYPPTKHSALYVVLGALGLTTIGAIAFMGLNSQRYALVPAQRTPFVWKLDRRTGQLQYCRFDANAMWCVDEDVFKPPADQKVFTDEDLERMSPTPSRAPSEVPYKDVAPETPSRGPSGPLPPKK